MTELNESDYTPKWQELKSLPPDFFTKTKNEKAELLNSLRDNFKGEE